MIRFRKAYEKVEESVRPSCEGSRTYREAKVIFEPDGNMYLEEGKERDRVAEINSYKDSCDVNNIVKRYQNGDSLALLRDNTGVYCDISSMPSNVHEAVKLSSSVESVYNNLGDDIKSYYPNFSDFLSAFSSDNAFSGFISNVNEVVKKRAEPFVKKSDVKE